MTQAFNRAVRKLFGRGRTRKAPGQMNKLEGQYAHELELRKRAGDVAVFGYESIKLRLADKTTYTPDFFVMLSNGEVEFHEVKGHWEQAARVKIKVAAELFPFRFVAVTFKEKAWCYEEF